MTTVLERKFTASDSLSDLLTAIHRLASDKSQRVLLQDENAWLETKLGEIARMATIAQKKAKGYKAGR